MAAKITALHACECSNWAFDLDADTDTDYDTGCTAMTVRTFAQGHDAKLAGFMARAEIAGHGCSRTDGGVMVTFNNAVLAAASISDALGVKVENQIVAQRARAGKKAAKAPRKAVESPERALAVAAGIVAPEPVEAAPVVELAPIEARIKVGRWTYDARIDRETAEATFATKLGGTKTVARGAYTVL